MKRSESLTRLNRQGFGARFVKLVQAPGQMYEVLSFRQGTAGDVEEVKVVLLAVTSGAFHDISGNG